MAAADLVLLTSSFPFGSVSEPFLETELPIIASYFRSVYVLPSELADGVARVLPANAEVVEMPWVRGYDATARRKALASMDSLRVLGWSLQRWQDLAKQAANPRLYADILARNILKARDLTDFVRSRDLAEAVFYDYWFENSTLALTLLRSRKTVTTAVARAHGFDVYDARWGGRPIPFRQAKARHLDAVFPVSHHGAAYLASRVPSLAGRLTVHHLGVTDPRLSSPPQDPTVAPLIVTCARLISSKRVHLVPEVLAALERPVRWAHLGDGPERERIEQVAQRLLAPGSWEILGSLSNQDVLGFYANRSVQVLLSLSESEGLPVSMMEAQSLGIPIVACDVGGVPEIVSPKSGALITIDASAAQAASAIRRVLDAPELTREAIRDEFRSGYDAESNYRGFVNDLLALRARTAALPGSGARPSAAA